MCEWPVGIAAALAAGGDVTAGSAASDTMTSPIAVTRPVRTSEIVWLYLLDNVMIFPLWSKQGWCIEWVGNIFSPDLPNAHGHSVARLICVKTGGQVRLRKTLGVDGEAKNNCLIPVIRRGATGRRPRCRPQCPARNAARNACPQCPFAALSATPARNAARSAVRNAPVGPPATLPTVPPATRPHRRPMPPAAARHPTRRL